MRRDGVGMEEELMWEGGWMEKRWRRNECGREEGWRRDGGGMEED